MTGPERTLRDERYWRRRVTDAIGDHERLTEQIEAVMEWVVRPLRADTAEAIANAIDAAHATTRISEHDARLAYQNAMRIAHQYAKGGGDE